MIKIPYLSESGKVQIMESSTMEKSKEAVMNQKEKQLSQRKL